MTFRLFLAALVVSASGCVHTDTLGDENGSEVVKIEERTDSFYVGTKTTRHEYKVFLKNGTRFSFFETTYTGIGYNHSGDEPQPYEPHSEAEPGFSATRSLVERASVPVNDTGTGGEFVYDFSGASWCLDSTDQIDYRNC